MSSNSSKHKSQSKTKKSNTSSKSKSKKSSRSSGSSSSSAQNILNEANVNTTSTQPLTIQANLNHLNSSETASPNSVNREKSCQRSYVGLSSKTIKCIWEQYDSNETEINSEILPVLAEDASYKLWELANNLKTFTKHSGGKLTTDIVNEVLKDCNIPPIIGARAGNCGWNRMDYDGTYYFQDDEIIDLRDEYIREISSIQCGPLALECCWLTNQRNYRDLTKFWKSIMLAVVMGDDAAYQYTIHTTMINPFISCILPYILQKCVEYLSFTCTEDTLERIIDFLKAISYNEYCRDVNITDACFNLSSVFVCLLFGREDIKIKLERIKKESLKEENVKTEMSSKIEPINGVTKIETKPKIKSEIIDSHDHDNYSKLVVNPAAMGIKREINNFDYERKIKFEPNFYDTEFPDPPMFGNETETVAETENAKPEIVAKDEMINIKYFDDIKIKQEMFSSFEAEICDDRFVDDICELIGCFASKWGTFEYEMIYLLSKKLEIFFFEIKTWTITEFKWLQRMIQVLFALGEIPFRELTIYFDQIPYNELPEWVKSRLNLTAVYIRGKRDIYFYEYMQHICGDSLAPFLLYHSKYLKKIQKDFNNKTNGKVTKIQSKLLLTNLVRNKIEKESKPNSMDEIFPERTDIIKAQLPTKRKIGFKFAGCCPVPAKPRKNLSIEQKFEQSSELLERFNTRFVICRRKLLKSIFLDDKQKISNLCDYRFYTL